MKYKHKTYKQIIFYVNAPWKSPLQIYSQSILKFILSWEIFTCSAPENSAIMSLSVYLIDACTMLRYLGHYLSSFQIGWTRWFHWTYPDQLPSQTVWILPFITTQWHNNGFAISFTTMPQPSSYCLPAWPWLVLARIETDSSFDPSIPEEPNNLLLITSKIPDERLHPSTSLKKNLICHSNLTPFKN